MGRIVGDPKIVMAATASKEPVTAEQLAEVEKNIYKTLKQLEDALLDKNGEAANND